MIPNPWKIGALILGVLLALSAVGGGLQTARLWWAQSSLATERADRAEENARRAQAVADAQARTRALELQHVAAQQQIVEAYRAEVEKRDAALAAVERDADELRQQVDAYSRGDGGPEAAAATCGDLRRRAATLGELFKRADRTAGRMAKAADQHADQLRLALRQLQTDRSVCSPGVPGGANAGPTP